MLDVHVYQMMLSLHEQLRDQKVVADESVLLVHAMKRSLLDSEPGFETIFDQHYRALAAGAIGKQNAATLRELDGLIVELRRLSQSP